MTEPSVNDDPFGDAGDPDVSQRGTENTVRVSRGGPVISGKHPAFPAPRNLPSWADASPQDYGDGVDEQIDYTDLDSVNRDLTRLRVRLNRARRGMREAAREAVEAKLVYHRALRRALVQQSGGTAEMRRATAELLCEELEADMVMKQQVADEFTSVFRSVRDDIENTKTIAYNLRALVNLV